MAWSPETADSIVPANAGDVLGYLMVFLPPALLALGWAAGHGYLLAFFFFCILPFSRVIFGAAPEHSPVFSDRHANFLYWIPTVYAALGISCAVWMPWPLRDQAGASHWSITGLLFSTLVAFGLVSCVAHALIHQANWRRSLGGMLSSVCANPWLRYEHLRHHARARDTAIASAPYRNESVYSFAWRRTWLIPKACFDWRRSAVGRSSVHGIFDDLYMHVATTVTVWLWFAWIAGPLGALFYGSLVFLVPALISCVNYMQHWGLGDDVSALPPAIRQVGWDDDCQVLTWLTMGLNFHDGHHQEANRAYFLQDADPNAPRLPFSYGFALLASFVPPLWYRVMNARLEHWLADPASVGRAGKQLFCFSAPKWVQGAPKE